MRSSRVTPNTVATPIQWNALHEDARGASRLLAHQMYGTLALPTNPTNGQTVTVTINGAVIVLTAVSSIGTTPGSFAIAGTAALTLANLYSLLTNPTITNANQYAVGLNTDSNVTQINLINWSVTGTNLIISSSNFTLYTAASAIATTTVTGGSYTANQMALYVEPGVVYVNGTEVYFTGGVTPTVTAPSSHPRIDVLTLDSSGTLAWTTGTENASPATPTYPANKIPICEIYNVTGEAALYDNSNQLAGEGYVLNDVRPFLAYPIPLAAVPDSIIPAADATYNLGSPSFEWNNVYAKAGIFVNGVGVSVAKFGGNGTDGALIITSGTTTINCGNAAVVVKNYSSISITGTGALAFSNPHANGTIIILKSQGNVTLTSSATPMIDVSGMGASGGTGGAAGTHPGNVGSSGNPFFAFATNGGSGGTTGPGGGPGGALPTAIAPASFFNSLDPTILKYGGLFWVGAGGGGGGSANGSNSGTCGTGGIGGGGLIMECGGSFNFTTASGISVAGKVGGNPTDTTYGGAGGGGAGGFAYILYATLTAASGTITVSGGAGGTNGSNANSAGGGGGGNAYAAGSIGSTGTGTNTGTGANGVSLIAVNNDYS